MCRKLSSVCALATASLFGQSTTPPSALTASQERYFLHILHAAGSPDLDPEARLMFISNFVEARNLSGNEIAALRAAAQRYTAAADLFRERSLTLRQRSERLSAVDQAELTRFREEFKASTDVIRDQLLVSLRPTTRATLLEIATVRERIQTVAKAGGEQ